MAMGEPVAKWVARRRLGSPAEPLPIDRPADWALRVAMPMTPAEEEAVRWSLRRGQPYGSAPWQKRMASRLGLGSTLRPRGRPPKSPNNGT